MSGMGVTSKATSFVDLVKDMQAADNQKYIRAESSGKSIYTSSTAGGAVMHFLAKIGVGFAKEREDRLRENGVKAVEKMIDRDFGEGIGKKVLTSMTQWSARNDGEGARDYSKGVTVSDLTYMYKVASRIQRQEEFAQNPIQVDNRVLIPELPQNTNDVPVFKKSDELETLKITIPNTGKTNTQEFEDIEDIIKQVENEIGTEQNLSEGENNNSIAFENNISNNLRVKNSETDEFDDVDVEEIEDVIRQVEEFNVDPSRDSEITERDDSSGDKNIRKSNHDFDDIDELLKGVPNNKAQVPNTDDLDEILNMIDEVRGGLTEKDDVDVDERELNRNLDLVSNHFDEKRKAAIKEKEEEISDEFDILMQIEDERKNNTLPDSKGFVELIDFDLDIENTKDNK